MITFLDAVCEGRCPETDLIVYSRDVRIAYVFHPASGDGWNDPREDAYVEFDYAAFRDNVREPVPGHIMMWAEAWFDANQQMALDAVGDARAEAQIYRAELRRDDYDDADLRRRDAASDDVL